MPPKRKKGKKKRKTADGELTVEDKYKKTLDEIEALKDHLAVRKELTRRSKWHEEEWRERMEKAESMLKEHENDHRNVSADMTRQYKTMQTEMGYRVNMLEDELQRTHKQLEWTESELKKEKEERVCMEREKNHIISSLEIQVNKMQSQFERILNDALDTLVDRMDESKPDWEDHSTYIQSKNKQTLLEFGLNPLDL